MPYTQGVSSTKLNNALREIGTTPDIRRARLKRLIESKDIVRIIEAHNGLTGLITENIHVNIDADNEIIDEASDFIFVRSDRKMIKLEFLDIIYIESLSDYIKIYLTNKTIVTRETITNIEAKLPKKDFIRLHRSYIVSISKIDLFTNEYVELNKKVIPISRTYKNDVLNRLENI